MPDKLIRTTIDFESKVHKALKVRSATKQESIKTYITNLIKKDLKL